MDEYLDFRNMVNKKYGLFFLLGCLVGIVVKGIDLRKKNVAKKHSPQIIQLGNVKELVKFEQDKDSLYQSDLSLSSFAHGCIDSPELAAQVCIACLCDIYGEDQIKEEFPFDVVEFQKSWLVEGNLPMNYYGGVASINISKNNGMVIRYIHGK